MLIALHGAWHQPSHFADFAMRLKNIGIDALIPDLAQDSLSARIAAAQQAVDSCAEPPLVLAHSFGGMVAESLTGIRHVIHLASYVLDPDETATHAAVQAIEQTGTPDPILSAMRPGPDGYTHIDPERAVEVFYADCATEVAEAAVQLLRPERDNIGEWTPAWVNRTATPNTYVQCEHDRALRPEIQGRFAARCSDTISWPTSHSAYLSRPDLVMDLIRTIYTADSSMTR
ncbi:alpha/beta hydrolase [Streptomyces rhizosphaericus]|uniref:Alpha/beta hydrolase n=1 Tax=Streptomyces rhizosphaericus TaxID=114699 RepID=A0A6G4A9D5_9ACTN|nr:alpha/beta hydrolase [Streptomyces rhizosphaericus]NEW69915.1 alpha/beta hydrolase [Streptomyces rhizosphaericus]